MKTFLVACVVAIVVAVVGAFILDGYQQPVQKAFATQYVRLGA
jgi:hypothetical protein